MYCGAMGEELDWRSRIVIILIFAMMLIPFVVLMFDEPSHSHSWEVQNVEGEYVTFCEDCGEIADHSVNMEKSEYQKQTKRILQ